MFTGIIESRGKVVACQQKGLIIAADFANLAIGESIAVNGACLTLAASEAKNLVFDVSPETLKLTNLGNLALGQAVNLERAMTASARFGGHYVSGHVDGVAEVKAIHSLGSFHEVELSGFNGDAKYYLIPKGSISVDGVSLTINSVTNQSIKFMLVPQTLAQTTLGSLQVGQKVNIEFDYLARVVQHMLKLGEGAVCT